MSFVLPPCKFPSPSFFPARKSRWGDEGDKAVVVAGSDGKPQVVEGRSPQLVAYAMKVFGSADLEPHQWKQCEDQMKVGKSSKKWRRFFSFVMKEHPCTEVLWDRRKTRTLP